MRVSHPAVICVKKDADDTKKRMEGEIRQAIVPTGTHWHHRLEVRFVSRLHSAKIYKLTGWLKMKSLSNKQTMAVSPSMEHHAFTSLIQLCEGQGGKIQTYSNIYFLHNLVKNVKGDWLQQSSITIFIFIWRDVDSVFVKVYRSRLESLFWWLATWLDKK